MELEVIKKCAKRLKFSSHAKTEMLSEEFGMIQETEVKEALKKGEIIEGYPEDKPYPTISLIRLAGSIIEGGEEYEVCSLWRGTREEGSWQGLSIGLRQFRVDPIL